MGIDSYPAAPLHGCVADAQLWQRTLTELGFDDVRLMTDAQATRAGLLRALGAAAGIARLDAGPNAVALTPCDPMDLPALAERLGGTVKGERLILPLAVADPVGRAERVAALLGG